MSKDADKKNGGAASTPAQKPAQKIHAIRLDDPGVIACGRYKRGVVYRVGDDGLTQEEATRLVAVKGFATLTEAQIAADEKAKAEPAKTTKENDQ